MFIIHPDKSIFLQSQEITYLGFNLNSQMMKRTLHDTKKGTLNACSSELLNDTTQTIRYATKVSGLIISITKGTPDTEISLDASSYGWGAACNNIRTGELFSLEEMVYHTNVKRLLAPKFSLKTILKVSNTYTSGYLEILLLYMAQKRAL